MPSSFSFLNRRRCFPNFILFSPSLCFGASSFISFSHCSEFTLAEIEHFVNPNDKRHARFSQVRDIELNLFGRDLQNTPSGQAAKIPVGQAVASVSACFQLASEKLFETAKQNTELNATYYHGFPLKHHTTSPLSSCSLFFLFCPCIPVHSQGLINNETLGYFMARTHLFLVRCGIKPHLIRFRQHLKNEMAHYAKDCWDAEVCMSYVGLFLGFAWG